MVVDAPMIFSVGRARRLRVYTANDHFRYQITRAADRSVALDGYTVGAAALSGFMGARVEMACL